MDEPVFTEKDTKMIEDIIKLYQEKIRKWQHRLDFIRNKKKSEGTEK